MTKRKMKMWLMPLCVMAVLCAVVFGSGFAMSARADDGCVHDYAAEEIAATCTERGYTLYTCANCGDTRKDKYTDVKGHTYKQTAVNPTCTDKGYILYVCEDCGEHYTETTAAAKGHVFSEITVPATCTHK